ncbi:MAG: hypothetical protein ACLU8F_05975 [Clostridia bacterium]
MKKAKKVCILILVCIAVGICFNLYQNYRSSASLENQLEDSRGNVDMEKKILEKKGKAQTLISEISNEPEIILSNISGTYQKSYDKTPENHWWSEWLFNADITIYSEYVVMFSLPLDKVDFSILEDGRLSITFDTNAIHISSVQLENVRQSSHSGWFNGYSHNEFIALEEIAKEEIQKEVIEKVKLEDISTSFESLLTEKAKKLGITDFVFNKKVITVR